MNSTIPEAGIKMILSFHFISFLNFTEGFFWHLGSLLSPGLGQPRCARDFNIPRVTSTNKGSTSVDKCSSFPSLIGIILRSIVHGSLDLEGPQQDWTNCLLAMSVSGAIFFKKHFHPKIIYKITFVIYYFNDLCIFI